MNARFLGLTLGLSLAGIVGCGDDTSTPATPDAAVTPTPDAPPPPPDAPPRSVFKGSDADGAGEVRRESVRFASGPASARATNFLYSNPGTPRYHDFININGCQDTTASMRTKWPFAMSADRVYADPGEVLITGGPNTLTVPTRVGSALTDPYGRVHPDGKAQFHFGGSGGTDGPTYLTEKTAYDVTFTGSADLPGQVFEDVLYMPADFAIISPAIVDGNPLIAGQSQTYTWTTPANGQPTGVEIQSLVAYTGPNGPAVVCVEPNDGSITVPANLVDIARTAYPSGGTLARQTLTHVVRELVDDNGPTGRRIDFVAVWCYATPFTVPAAP